SQASSRHGGRGGSRRVAGSVPRHADAGVRRGHRLNISAAAIVRWPIAVAAGIYRLAVAIAALLAATRIASADGSRIGVGVLVGGGPTRASVKYDPCLGHVGNGEEGGEQTNAQSEPGSEQAHDQSPSWCQKSLRECFANSPAFAFSPRGRR